MRPLKQLGDARVYISLLAAISELDFQFAKVNEEHGSTHKLPLVIRNRRCDAPANCVDGNDFTLVQGCVIKEGYTLPLHTAVARVYEDSTICVQLCK